MRGPNDYILDWSEQGWPWPEIFVPVPEKDPDEYYERSREDD